MWVKNHGGPVVHSFIKPLHNVGLFLVRFVGVPVYRLFFFVRRLVGQIIKPTKHRLLSFVTNRFAAHAVVVVLVSIVVGVNIQTHQVRAESVGQKSILHQLVVSDSTQTIDVVQVSDRVLSLGTSSRYISDNLVDPRSHIDFNYLGEDYVTPETGSDRTESRPTVPARDTIETYVIQEGDTLGGIAKQFGLNLSTILWANNLTFKSTIRPGDSLKILMSDGVMHTVKSGDTLSTIARRYGVTTKEILDENTTLKPDRLSIGDELIIPGGEPPTVSAVTPKKTSVANLFVPPSKSVAVSGWIWPTDWHVITQYYGWKHTGIDVDGDYSTNNYAARDGVVSYAGWRNGYGLTVEVDHGDGYKTRYAHHSKIIVETGDVVTAGQAVGKTGTTGRSTGTHLHFEVIKNGKFQNPLDYVR